MKQLFSDFMVTKEKEVYQVYDRYTVFDVYLIKRDGQGNLVSRQFVYRECEWNML